MTELTQSFRRVAAALLTLLALSLGACASRPGPSVLTPVAGIQGAKLVTIYVATTRLIEPDDPTRPTDKIGAAPEYLRYVVSIPPTHKATEIEWPSEAADPQKSFAVVSAERLGEASFFGDVGAAAARGEALDRDVGIFVHGFNNSFQESLFRLAQLVADGNVGQSAVLFSWPSKAALAGYIADKEAVTFSRDALTHVVVRIAADRRARGVKLVAHSMGSWLTMEAVRQIRIAGDERSLAKLNDVTLAAPDIDADVFLQQLHVIGRLRTPITVLVAKEDRALSISRFLAGGQLRAGAADIDDPRVLAGARNANLRVIDISSLATEAGSGHDGFTAFAPIYGRLHSQRYRGNAGTVGAGVYALDAADRLRPLDARLAQKGAP